MFYTRGGRKVSATDSAPSPIPPLSTPPLLFFHSLYRPIWRSDLLYNPLPLLASLVPVRFTVTYSQGTGPGVSNDLV